MPAGSFNADKHPRGERGRFAAGAASVPAHPIRMAIHRTQRDARLNSLDNRATAMLRDAPHEPQTPEPEKKPTHRAMAADNVVPLEERRSLARGSKAWTIGSRTHGMPVAYTGSTVKELPVGGFKVAQLDFHPKPAGVSQDDHEGLRHSLRQSIVSLRDPTIEAGMQPKKRGKQRGQVLIPEGTERRTVNRAFNHAAALALHGYGVGHYDFAMSDELKTELKPLEGFIRYAQRNLMAHMLATQKGGWKPYRAEHGLPFADRRTDRATGEVRLRVRPQHVLIKAFEEAKHARGRGGRFASAGSASAGEAASPSSEEAASRFSNGLLIAGGVAGGVAAAGGGIAAHQLSTVVTPGKLARLHRQAKENGQVVLFRGSPPELRTTASDLGGVYASPLRRVGNSYATLKQAKEAYEGGKTSVLLADTRSMLDVSNPEHRAKLLGELVRRHQGVRFKSNLAYARAWAKDQRPEARAEYRQNLTSQIWEYRNAVLNNAKYGSGENKQSETLRLFMNRPPEGMQDWLKANNFTGVIDRAEHFGGARSHRVSQAYLLHEPKFAGYVPLKGQSSRLAQLLTATRGFHLIKADSGRGLAKAFEEAKHARGRGGKFTSGAKAAPTEEVSTASGRKLKVRYEVVPGHTLKQASGALQPRERGDRMAYDAQVNQIAAKLDPKRLMRAPEVDRGAPVVGRDNVVESGNGRVRAIMLAADKHPDRHDAYVQALKDDGHDVAGVEKPILIARRVSRLSATQRVAFVREANTSATAAMSASEQARMDGQALTPGMMQRYDPQQSPTSAGNRAFVRAWMASVPASERNNLTTDDGSLSSNGLRRLHGAILSRAYGNTGVLARGLEAVDDTSRSMTGALLDAAPAWAALRMATEAGHVPHHFDVAQQLIDATGTVRVAREKKQGLSDIVKQHDIFARPDPIKEQFVRALFSPDGKRMAARPMIADVLTRYAHEAGRQTGKSLLGSKDQVTPHGALRAIVASRDAHAKGKEQGGLFDRVAKLAKAFEEGKHKRSSSGEFASGGEKADLVQPAQILGGALGASLLAGAAGAATKKKIGEASSVVGRRAAAGFRLSAGHSGAMHHPDAANIVRHQAKLVGHLSRLGTKGALKIGVGLAGGLAGDFIGDKLARIATGKTGHEDEYRHASVVGMATGMLGMAAGHKIVGSRLWRPLRYKGVRRSLAGLTAAMIGSIAAESGGNLADEKIHATDMLAGVNRRTTARMSAVAGHAVR